MSLTPFVYQDNELTTKKGKIQKFAFAYIFVGVCLLLPLYFFYEEVGSLLLSQNYSEGFYIIFWIANAYLIMTLTYLYESIFYAEHNTRIILFSNIASAVANIGFNFLLVPFFAINGAIAAMLISVTIRFSFIFYRFKKL
ncbi:MAG: polysaccharide biosynthesis C-terminal domain-containing protein [Balneolaceae bacterium]|nr:polysaccharide biosynthesis C-terminal domain-containing protein [Balneolaceae bacterium]